MPKTNTADIAFVYTYEWANPEQTSLRRIDADGNLVWVPADPLNRDYAEFLSSGAEASPFVEPPPPPELSTEEKVNNMLAAYGLTREEMQAALAAK